MATPVKNTPYSRPHRTPGRATNDTLNKKVVQSNPAPAEPHAPKFVPQKPLIVIVGPTASGKSAVAMELAQQVGGELICADSRTVYKHMDIGTAKPSAADQKKVPHHGLDLAEPGTRYTAADFQKYAQAAIASIHSRGKTPIMVGGSGLYIDGLIFDYSFAKADPKQRALLNRLSLQELHDYCANNNISLPENQQNRRHVIRAIERKNVRGKRLREPIPNTLIVGIATERAVLRTKIEARIEHMFEDGVVQEAKMLGKKYGWESEAMTGNIYRQIHEFLNSTMNQQQGQHQNQQQDQQELRQRCITADYQLAKRQLTWFKRNPHIVWMPANEVNTYVVQWLKNVQTPKP